MSLQNKKIGSKIGKILSHKIFPWIVLIGLGLVFYLSMFSNVRPQRLNIQMLEVSEQTIRAPFTVEDPEQTEKKKQEALDLVKPVFIVKQEYAENRVDLIASIFDAAIAVNNDIQKQRQDAQNQENVEMDQEAEETDEQELPQVFVEPTVEEKVEMFKGKLTETVVNDLSTSTITALVKSNNSQLKMAKDAAITAVQKVMSNSISANEVENAKKKVEDELSFISLPQDLKEATIELGRYAIIQNEFYDPEKTEEQRKQAVDSVEPVYILQGQVIVEQGQLVSQEIYRQLELLGLLDTDDSILPYIGLTLFVIVLVGGIYFNLNGLRENLKKNKDILLFATVITISVLFMKGISLLPIGNIDLSYLFPAAMATMLIKILINDRLSFISAVILAACSTIIYNGETSASFHLTSGIYTLFSGLAGIIFLTGQNHRSKIFEAGLFVSLVNLIILAAFLFMPNLQFSTTMQYVYYFVLGVVSGIGSAVLTIGLLPFLEAGFGILSTIKLIELSNPNHPLLKKILTEAPGTYHHSVMVANLADAACEAIGANGLLARVGSYYHDIGKTNNPKYFIENQMNMTNPHDYLEPERSKDIIISHTTDGANLLKKHKMPKEIVDIALQHHGTSFLKYFYAKAKDAGHDVTEDDFRYPGPKPQTKEAAIISIADSVEAAVRSMSEPTMEKIEALVKKIIQDKLNDQQFNECDLTLKELTLVEKTLNETLHGIFHSRIEYPELKNER